MEMGETLSIASSNGIDVYYEMVGSGDPVVLVGGLGTDSSFLRPIAKVLAEQFMVLSFDNRGAGQSAKPDLPYTVEMMAADTVGLMDAVGLKRALFV